MECEAFLSVGERCSVLAVFTINVHAILIITSQLFSICVVALRLLSNATPQLNWIAWVCILPWTNARSTLKEPLLFNVVTYHKPLEGVFKKDLFDIGNQRLQRIREKLLEYNFSVTWCSILASIS